MSWGRVAWVPLVMASLLLNFQGDLIAQKFDSIDPVRVGNEIEYKWFSDWKPGTVVAYANGVATVEFEFGSPPRLVTGSPQTVSLTRPSRPAD